MDEKTEQWIRMLEAQWSKPDGFLGKAREGIFDEQQAEDFIKQLADIRLSPSDPVIERRLVALVWYIPIFLGWQEERIAERGNQAAAFRRMQNRVNVLVEEILGIP